MIQITPHMRIMVAPAAADFRRGIDGLAQLCLQHLASDPFSGTLFVFRNKPATSLKILVYDGQGFWLCQKRLSEGNFRYWPKADGSSSSISMLAHELYVLLGNGDPKNTSGAPAWRGITP